MVNPRFNCFRRSPHHPEDESVPIQAALGWARTILLVLFRLESFPLNSAERAMVETRLMARRLRTSLVGCTLADVEGTTAELGCTPQPLAADPILNSCPDIVGAIDITTQSEMLPELAFSRTGEVGTARLGRLPASPQHLVTAPGAPAKFRMRQSTGKTHAVILDGVAPATSRIGFASRQAWTPAGSVSALELDVAIGDFRR